MKSHNVFVCWSLKGQRYLELLLQLTLASRLLDRDCSIGKLLAIFRLFCLVLASSKPPTPIHIGPFTPLICADLRGVTSPREIDGNPQIGGPEQCQQNQC